MVKLPPLNETYLVELLIELLNIPSPTGYTDQVVSYLEERMGAFSDLILHRSAKGALIATWAGDSKITPRGLTAHIDTLGAMVKEIKPNGRLKLSQLGGYAWNTIEGEGCTVFASGGGQIRGSILFNKASSHVYGKKVGSKKRSGKDLEVRLDIRTASIEETRQHGIQVGDFVAFDPRVEVNQGFIRSRHLDDKACVACLMAAVQVLQDAGLQPAQQTVLHFSNYEEVGHGAAAGLPEGLKELVVVDMAAVGEGQTSDEFHATLCVKDTYGPYHHGLSQQLRELGDKFKIPYKVDIYPYYGSDGEAYWRAGGDVAVALIGPGVDASHNYERTHQEALAATTRWIMAYLLSQ
jgi:putative aminopeptidase FrvX